MLHTTGHPHHHGDGHGGCIASQRVISAASKSSSATVTAYFAQPLSCEDQNLTFNNPEMDLVIDGDGTSPCLDAENTCFVDIVAKSITFANCGTCIRANKDSNVTLSAKDGEIACTGTGVDADASSDVSFFTADN